MSMTLTQLILVTYLLLCPTSNLQSTDPWIIPSCMSRPKWSHTLFFMVELSQTKGAKTTKVTDADYEAYYIRYGPSGELLQIASGTHWCGAPECQPPKEDFASSAEFSSRELRIAPTQEKGKFGTDWRGKSKDGGYWRYIGVPFESITYRNVSAAAAAFFDSIIENACYQEPVIPGSLYLVHVISIDNETHTIVVDDQGKKLSLDVSKAKMKGKPKEGGRISVEYLFKAGRYSVSKLTVEVTTGK